MCVERVNMVATAKAAAAPSLLFHYACAGDDSAKVIVFNSIWAHLVVSERLSQEKDKEA